MATEQFFKLKEEKQHTILEAGKHEFEVFPYSDASINRVIKVANISRGSFYLYFKDKNDLLMTLMDQLFIQPFHNEMEQQTLNKLNAFDYTVICFTSLSTLMHNESSLSRQILRNGSVEQIHMMMQALWPKGYLAQSNINQDNLRFHSITEKTMLEETLKFVLFFHLTRYICEDEPFEQAKTKLLKHLLTLKIGFQK